MDLPSLEELIPDRLKSFYYNVRNSITTKPKSSETQSIQSFTDSDFYKDEYQ